MKVYFVGPPGGTFDAFEALMQGRRVMYSFATCRSTPVPEGIEGYALDSGAYTAWKQGRRVNMDRLVEWYERHDSADFRLMLDEIGGSEMEQRRALYEMERAGQDVVPVFHGPGCESWRWFDELCERYPLVALGSIVKDNTSEAATRWLMDVFDRVCDRETGLPRVALHGLRMTSRMSDFPFASVDGSTWVTAAKNGRMPTRRGQTEAPLGFASADLQEMWVRAWDAAPKCERYYPRAPSPQLTMFGEPR